MKLFQSAKVLRKTQGGKVMMYRFLIVIEKAEGNYSGLFA